MEFTVSPYISELNLPRYKETNFDPTLEVQMLERRQRDYSVFLDRVSNLQRSALNVSMLNLKGQQKLDAYNKELDEMLAETDLDLSMPDVQSQVASYFTKISNDADLKKRSQLSRHYQDQLEGIERMRSSKDPTKSGYNSVNETVFRKWEGGLDDFALADDITGFERKMQSYVPYKDIDQKLVNLTKLLHAEENTTLQPSSQGYTLLESEKGVSKERIRNLLQSTLDQDELSQIEIMSKYRLLQQNSPQGLSQLHDTYSNWLSQENQRTKNELEKAKAYMEQFSPKNLDPKLSKEEKATKEAQYVALQQQYQEAEQELNRKLVLQTTNTLTKEEWFKKGTSDLLPYVNQMTLEGYVNGIADSLAWKDTVKKVGTDEAYFANRRLNLMEDRLNWDKEIGTARLKLDGERTRLEREKAEKEKSTTNYSEPADIFKSPETIIDSWDRLANLTKEYQNRTQPIITAKDNNGNSIVDPKNLIDDQWLQNNQGNYEVQLWNAYKAKFFDTAFTDKERKNPNLHGFEAFKKQVENGDYKNDAVLNNISEAYVRDNQIGNYLTKTTDEIVNTINKTSDIEDVSTGGNTLGDYARQHGWTGEGEMKFGLRDGKGGYKTMTWSEIKKEYEDATSNSLIGERLKNFKDVAIAGVVNTVYPGMLTNLVSEIVLIAKQQKPDKDYHIFRDPAFLTIVAKAVEEENKNAEAIRDVYLNKMPQIFQGKQLTALDDKTRTQSIGWINQAIKGSSEDVPASIDSKEVTNVSIPYGIGDYGGFSITEKEAERLNALGAKIVTVGGEEMEPKANVWYKVPMQPVAAYDLLLNQVFEKEGVIENNIQGHKVRIASIDNNPNYFYLYFDNEAPKTIPKRDVTMIFKELDNAVTAFKQASQTPK